MTELKVQLRRGVHPAIKRLLFERSGNECAFPGCRTLLITSEGSFIGHICHIEHIAQWNPRYSPNRQAADFDRPDNLIVLCPTHHTLVDSDASLYSADWLRRVWADHTQRVESSAAKAALSREEVKKLGTVSFPQALEIWQANQTNDDEEFWQQFFGHNPMILAQAVPDQIIKIGEKCYLGGKGIDNTGGNISDYLFATASNRNLIIIEIKTPKTPLLGRKYRANAYAISEDLSGAVVQTLSYRDELLKSYYNLTGRPDSIQFNAFDPQCLIIIGHLFLDNLSALERRSFELFRRSNTRVQILTYDELFAKVQDLVDLLAK